jgi:hypothetical protein
MPDGGRLRLAGVNPVAGLAFRNGSLAREVTAAVSSCLEKKKKSDIRGRKMVVV